MSPRSTLRAVLERYFMIPQRGSTVAREIRGGVVTFVTMAYIVVLNPLIIGSFAADAPGAKRDVLGAILPVPQVAAVTALVAGVLTLAMGLVVNYPFAMATGLGLNSFVALAVAPLMSWPQAMGLVMINGLVVLVLVAVGARQAVFNAVPAELKAATAAGIGLFICFIGFVDAGLVRRMPDSAGTTVPVGLGVAGRIATWPTAVFVVGLLITGALAARRIRGAILLGVLVTALLAIIVEAIVQVGPSKGTDPRGWSLGYPAVPERVFAAPDLALVGQVCIGCVLSVPILTVVLLVFTLVLTDFFDSIGTITGLSKEAGFVRPDGVLPGVGKALAVDALGAVAGGAASSSSNTVYIESAAGIAEGARTGLASVVTGLLFLAAMFLTPLYSVIPIEAAAPALVIVGALMVGQVREIDFSDLTVALPAFLTIVMMPFTYSIANGVGAGFISWVLLHVVTGRRRGIHPLMWVVAVLFVLYFAPGPFASLLGIS
jgi:AGZA family xanthine/uracil permease-like MFS transporter